MREESVIHLQIAFLQLQLATLKAITAISELGRLFEDHDEWYAVNTGQWPDEFVLLNRFVRTGVRPPFIFND